MCVCVFIFAIIRNHVNKVSLFALENVQSCIRDESLSFIRHLLIIHSFVKLKRTLQKSSFLYTNQLHAASLLQRAHSLSFNLVAVKNFRRSCLLSWATRQSSIHPPFPVVCQQATRGHSRRHNSIRTIPFPCIHPQRNTQSRSHLFIAFQFETQKWDHWLNFAKSQLEGGEQKLTIGHDWARFCVVTRHHEARRQMRVCVCVCIYVFLLSSDV